MSHDDEENNAESQPSAGRDHLLPADVLLNIDSVCERFESEFRQDKEPSIDDFLAAFDQQPFARERAFQELLLLEWHLRSERAEAIDIAEYQHRFSQFGEKVSLLYLEYQNAGDVSSPSPRTEATIDFNAYSQTEELARWIDRFRQDRKTNPALDPSDWLLNSPNVPESLRNAIQGMEYLDKFQQNKDGEKRIGEFRIIREIGRGGMGIVFEAEQESLDRTVALKILWFGAISDSDAIKRFQREASTVAKLHHTNIVPIFSVGSQGAINYYAMQFIDGQSLDAVAKHGSPSLHWSTIAEWGLQASEALEHAHQRGIIHRDVKPSNLLLDRENRIWLTDFGLAKRSDDVTLSMAGALLGTPRYMSPEQASSSTRHVDHRSDIYSLGASLYELATGRPVFDAKTPHGVISQILTSEPVPAGQISPELPRDFSTIVMKCLSKEATQRYESAKSLADDLRALLDRRPIRAKRPNWVDQSRKWVLRHRREFGWSIASVMASLLLLLTFSVGWYSWNRWREIHLSLSSPDSPIVAEVLYRDGRSASRPETVPTQDPLALSPGEYALRVQRSGLLSQDYLVDWNPSEEIKQHLHPTDQLIGPKITNAFDCEIVRDDSGAWIVYYDEMHLSFENRSVRSPKSHRIPLEAIAASDSSSGFVWPPRRLNTSSLMDNASKFDLRPKFYPESKDWNGDGRFDILMAMQHQAIVALIDPEKGVQWSVGLAPDTSAERTASHAQNSGMICPRSSVVEMPKSVSDIDGDGAEDIVVQVARINPFGNPDMQESSVELIALSGKNGERIWTYVVPKDLILSNASRFPYNFRWFTGPSSGSFSSGGGAWSAHSRWQRTSISVSMRQGTFVGYGSILVDPSKVDPNIYFQILDQWLRLDLKTGQLVDGPISLGAIPFRTPELGQCDDTLSQELIFVEDLENSANLFSPNLQSSYQMKLVAWSLDTKSQKWERKIGAHSPILRSWFTPSVTWPRIVDLDEDGHSEILVPDDTSLSNQHRTIQTSLLAVSGDTGKTLWKEEIRHADTQLDCFLVGPDVDGDRVRDVLVASMSGLPVTLHVDCLSGENGHPLWTTYEEVPSSVNPTNLFVSEPLLWNHGEDGWPQVVVSLQDRQESEQVNSLAFLFSSGTGRLLHKLDQFHRIHTADVDGDGSEDFGTTQYLSPRSGMHGMSATQFVRGSNGKLWSRLGAPSVLVNDLNGDHLADLLSIDHRQVHALDVVSGKRLWNRKFPDISPNLRIHSEYSERATTESSLPFRIWDFDQDGISDLILEHEAAGVLQSPLECLSGSTGKTLWKVKTQVNYQRIGGKVSCIDLDRDGELEVLHYCFNDAILAQAITRDSWSGNDGQLMLFVYSGKDGHLKWQVPLSRIFGSSNNTNMPYTLSENSLPELQFQNFNGDQYLDILVAGESSTIINERATIDLIALSGKSGDELWRRPGSVDNDPQNDAFTTSPSVKIARDLSGDKQLGAICLVDCVDGKDALGNTARYVRLSSVDGSNGEDLWTQMIPVHLYFHRSAQDRSSILRPSLLRRSTGEYLIAIGVYEQDTPKIILFDHQGKRIGERVLENRIDDKNLIVPLMVFDCDGDRNDEIIVINGRVEVYKAGDSIDQVFASELPLAPWVDVKLATIFDSVSELREIEIQVRDEHPRFFGIDARTGELRWSCFGPNRHPQYSMDYPVIQALRAGKSAIPIVVFNNLEQTDVRLGSPKPSSSLVHYEANKLMTIASKKFPQRIAKSDPRWTRPLPWTDGFRDSRSRTEFSILMTKGLVNAIFVVILPVWYVGQTIFRRAFTLKWWLLAPVVVAMLLAILFGPWFEMPVTKAQQFGLALYMTPPMALGLGLISNLVLGHWRSLRILGAGMISTALIVALAMLWNEWIQGRYSISERYSFEAWYTIFFYGWFVFGWIYLPFLIVKKVLKRRNTRRVLV